MNAEQIRQKAEKYAKLITASNKEHYRAIYIAAKEGYETGAHSRDREVMDLEHLLNAERTTNKVLVEANEKLRNPWISVEEKLPAKYELVLVKTGTGKLYLAEKDNITQPLDAFAIPQLNSYVNGITHWMQVPELKGE